MTGKKHEKPLHLDMDFGEALDRFTGVDPDEMPDSIKLRRKKAGKAKDPPGSKVENKGESDENG